MVSARGTRSPRLRERYADEEGAVALFARSCAGAMGRAALWAVALAAVLLTTQPSLAYAQGATRTRVCFNPVEIATG